MNNLIYIVDDNETILDLLRDILAEEPYEIETFQESERAYRRCLQRPPDLLLLDINMPGLDGVSFCRRIKEREELALIPVIFVSGLISTREKTQGFEAGGADYITKPFIAIDVVSRIRTHIKLKEFIDRTLSFNNALEEGIRERTRELQAAKEAAERADKAKTQLLSNINHELRTPLNGILGMLDLMKQRPIEDEELAMNLELAGYSAKHLSRLINDILDYTQLENRSLLFRYREFSLNTLFAMAKRTHQRACDEKGLILDIPLPPEELRFVGDRDRIFQVLNNLIANSVKYSLKGRVSVRFTLEEGTLALVVSDEGVGIPPEKQEEIFRPYVQLRSSYIRENQGLGLGLAITRNILEQMDGTIAAASGPRGTLFTVTVPAHREDALPYVPPAERASLPAGEEILIVEDDTVSLYYMEQILEEAGYRVSSEISGGEALVNLAENDYDLVILDIGLPGFSGYQVYREFKNRSRTPVIAVTAYCQEKEIGKFLKAGFRDVLPKPVEASLLLRKVGALLTASGRTKTPC